MPGNVGVYDFIHPSAANPNMKPRNSQANKNTGIPAPKATADNKRKQATMNSNEEDEENHQNQSQNSTQNSPSQSSKKRKNDHGRCECINKYDDLTSSLKAISESLKKLDKLDDIQNTVANIKADLQLNSSKVQNLEADVGMVHDELEQVQRTLEDFKSDKVRIEVEIRKVYLIITGIEDRQNETEQEIATKIETEVRKFNPQFQFHYDLLYRLGKFSNGKTRKIRVKFVTLRDRSNLIAFKKDTTAPFFIDEDEPNEIRAAKFQMRQKLRELKTAQIEIQSVNFNKFQIFTVQTVFSLQQDGKFIESQNVNSNPANNFLGSQN